MKFLTYFLGKPQNKRLVVPLKRGGGGGGEGLAIEDKRNYDTFSKIYLAGFVYKFSKGFSNFISKKRFFFIHLSIFYLFVSLNLVY